MPPPLVLYYRHGETDWNVESRLQGQCDVPINANGYAQTKRCGEILRDLFARDAIDPAGCCIRHRGTTARTGATGASIRTSASASTGRVAGFTPDGARLAQRNGRTRGPAVRAARGAAIRLKIRQRCDRESRLRPSSSSLSCPFCPSSFSPSWPSSSRRRDRSRNSVRTSSLPSPSFSSSSSSRR